VIKSKEDYRFYLEADRIALNRSGKSPSFYDHIWKFQRLLRKTEFLMNNQRGILSVLLFKFYSYRFHRLSLLLGYEIPLNTFGPGLSIAHKGTIVVHPQARIGSNCRLHVCVNIGTSAGSSSKVPRLGDNVYIGPGAKIYGDITIANGIAIGANAVVNKSFTEEGITIAGIPAKKISQKGSEGLLAKATEKIKKS
jgi:serine O-acetyltransferase